MPLTTDMIRTSLAEKNVRPVRTSLRERSYSDETITVESAITVSGVIAIITIISQDTASLPLILYGKKGRNKFRATDNPYYALMHDQPNPEHSAMTFREFIVSHMIAWGNFFGQIIADKAGTVQEIWPLRPDRMQVKRVDGRKIFLYQDSEGKPRVFFSDEVLHIPAFGFDGLVGLSRIALARHAIGLTQSTEKYGSKFFANDAEPGVIYKHPGSLSDPAYTHLNDTLKERSGVENSHKPIILEEGMSIEKLGIPNDDAQFLETRKFQLSEINRIVGPVPPHMIGDVEKSTSWGSGIENQEQGYVNHTLRPYTVRMEQGLNGQLLLQSDRQAGYFYEHLFDGFLRGDIATRYEAYVKGINNGFMSRNEVRAKENMNPRKGLDDLLQPSNMTTINGSGAADSASPDSQDNSSYALMPIWQDTVTRVMKRESNDLLGASKRYQAKGQQDEYVEWLNQFYSVDHPAFVKKQFQPVLDAEARLFGIDRHKEVHAFVTEFLFERIDQSLAMSHEALSATLDRYVETATQKFIMFLDWNNMLRSGADDLEIEYETE